MIHKTNYTWIPSLGQAVALLGVLFHWNALADPYSVSKYAIIAALCLAYACTASPKFGHLTIIGFFYMVVLIGVSALAFKSVCFVGKKLNYFTGVLPCALIAICYHYSIDDRWERIANAYVLACVVASVVAIAQAYGWFMPQGDFFDGRVYAVVGSPVFLSGTLAMAIPLCFGQRYAIIAIPILLTAIIFTQSRSGLVASMAGVIGYGYHRGLIGAKGGAFLAGVAVLMVSFMFSGLRNTAKSDMGRYHMARVAAKTVMDHPMGIGPERFAWAMEKYRDAALDRDMGDKFTNSYAHNHLIESLVSGGPLFLAVHIGLMAITGLFLFRFGSSSVFGAAMALCAFGLMQPTPLAMKCVLASILGGLEPNPRPLLKAPFVLAACAVFIASISAITCAKIFQDGLNTGLAEISVGAFDYQRSAIGDQ